MEFLILAGTNDPWMQGLLKEFVVNLALWKNQIKEDAQITDEEHTLDKDLA